MGTKTIALGNTVLCDFPRQKIGIEKQEVNTVVDEIIRHWLSATKRETLLFPLVTIFRLLAGAEGRTDPQKSVSTLAEKPTLYIFPKAEVTLTKIAHRFDDQGFFLGC